MLQQLLNCIKGAYPATAGGARGGGEGRGGLGRAVPRCRHIGCVMSHAAAATSCCVRVIGTCVACVAYAGRATMTRRGGWGRGGTIGKCAAARAVTWVSKSLIPIRLSDTQSNGVYGVLDRTVLNACPVFSNLFPAFAFHVTQTTHVFSF